MPRTVKYKTIIKCPICKFHKEMEMSEETRKVEYECPECGANLKPKPGECCVYTSYGDMPCPSVQEGNGSGCSGKPKERQ